MTDRLTIDICLLNVLSKSLELPSTVEWVTAQELLHVW
jgi:hypothetical protein